MWNAIFSWLKRLFAPKQTEQGVSPHEPVTEIPMQKPVVLPPGKKYTHMHPIDWVRKEKREKDPREISGSKDNPVIQEYLEHCDNIGGFKDGKLHHDEVPWCSALPNAAADSCGCFKTNNALASSWDKYSQCGAKRFKKGDKIPEGAIVRIAHPGGHVTLANSPFTWTGSGTFPGLGGNQGNRINVSSYSQEHIVSIHDWKAKPGTLLAPIGTKAGSIEADGNKQSTR